MSGRVGRGGPSSFNVYHKVTHSNVMNQFALTTLRSFQVFTKEKRHQVVSLTITKTNVLFKNFHL